ncbi:hypothetical protein [Yinghuangia sp. YIM S09857]|uniref:hypothetical protein n=1 Tax=Yinghuangia sp. YIM S09857 TaxID=3436929 RepID=UPI003F5295AF
MTEALRRSLTWLSSPTPLALPIRALTLALAWGLGLGGMAMLWEGVPGGAGGSVVWFGFGIIAAVLGGALGLSLFLPIARDETSRGSDRAWGAAGLVTTVVCALGAVAVLGFDQLARFWVGLGL